MPGGRRRLANVRKLMRLARDYEREHGPDLRGFLELIAQRADGRAAGARESEAPVEGEGLDAIRLMTIHRAKGLEFDTVCVADLGRSVRPPYELCRVGADGRIGLRLARSGQAGRASAWDYDAIGAQEREADEFEERRLFYVAMTRARERLILSGATRFEGWAEQRWTGGGPVGLDRAGVRTGARRAARRRGRGRRAGRRGGAARGLGPGGRLRPGRRSRLRPVRRSPPRPEPVPRARAARAAPRAGDAPGRPWPRSATRRSGPTPAAAIASTPSACSGLRRRRSGETPGPGAARARSGRSRCAPARPARAAELPPSERAHRRGGRRRRGRRRPAGADRRGGRRAGRPCDRVCLERAVRAPCPRDRRAPRGAVRVSSSAGS